MLQDTHCAIEKMEEASCKDRNVFNVLNVKKKYDK